MPIMTSSSDGGHANRTQSVLTQWAFVLGILGIIPLGAFAAVPAVVCGHFALRKVRDLSNPAPLRKKARLGLILGYCGVVLHLIVLPALLWPAFSTARERTRIQASGQQLADIGKLCFVYLMEGAFLDNRGERFPNTWGELEVGNLAIFCCPGSGTVPGSPGAVDEWSDYALVPGRTGADPQEAVLAYSKPHCFPKGGGHVLYVSGVVQWHDQESYLEIIKSE
jgi:hypothetical protein